MRLRKAANRTKVDPFTQRITKRSRLFVILPLVILSLSGGFLIWEILRLNFAPNPNSPWPWRLKLLDLQSSTTLFTFVALFLTTRLQYAKAMKPQLGWTIHPDKQTHGSLLRNSSNEKIELLWRVDIFDSGGGSAAVESVVYCVVPYGVETSASWVGHSDLTNHLTSKGLIENEDFLVMFFGRGALLTPPPHPSEMSLLAVFKPRAIARLGFLHIKLEVIDKVGDTHELVLDVTDKLPRAATLPAAVPGNSRGFRVVRRWFDSRRP